VNAPAKEARARLVLALHFHQPVGNFDKVFEDAVRLSYAPVVDQIERHPGVRAGFHLSGCLLEWLEAKDARFLDRVVALVGSGRVEPLGGGFYEPILAVIPRADGLEQIARLQDWWKKRAGTTPRGAWIAERVWEPALAELLADAGIAYTILDDQHLRFAGLLDDRFSGVFVTERGARPVAFFPSDFALRYLIPFRPIEQVREHLEKAKGLTLTYGDDAEKFGLWPDTYDWVHGQGWLGKFLALLEEPDGPAVAVTPSDVLDLRPETRKVYVPNASYTEMLEWALPAASVAAYSGVREGALKTCGAEAVRAFVRGSLWDMFLARYPESDQLHKHTLDTSRRVRALPAGPARERALTAALRAECNCPYWHGLFGGIYYNHLRHGAYFSLLEADAVLAEADGGAPRAEAIDLDGDLEREVVLRAGTTQAFLRPADGATLVELDELGARFNVTNVMSRWKESYHEGGDVTHGDAAADGVASPHEKAVGVRPADLEGRGFDVLPLRSFRDFAASSVPDAAGLARFEGMTLSSGRPESWEPSEAGFKARLRLGEAAWEKAFAIEADGTVRVRWAFASKPPAVFGTLLALSLLTPEDKDRSRRILTAAGKPIDDAPGHAATVDEAIGFDLEDRVFGFALEVRVDPAARLVATPIETLQRAEVRFEAAYQGTLFALCWPAGSQTGRRPAGVFSPEVRVKFRRLSNRA
jgi:hypothetical protein